MGTVLDIAATGVSALARHPLRAAVTVAAVTAVLAPFLAGMGLSAGLQTEAEAAVQSGSDLYVAGSAFGRPAPITVDAIPQVRAIDGVTDVVPRIIGPITLGRDRVTALLIGLPPDRYPDWAVNSVEGELPRSGGPNQLVVGPSLARRLSLTIGSMIPPFYRNNEEGDRVSRVVGVFRPDAPLWLANVILTTLDVAADVFDQPNRVTDLLVWCRPGDAPAVTRQLEQGLPVKRRAVRVRVTARQELLVTLPSGPRRRAGLFAMHLVLAFAVAVLVLLVTSGVGMSDRRREIGILKATGWQTDQVLVREAVGSLVLSLVGACVALGLAWVWLGAGRAYGLTDYFLTAEAPGAAVPYRLTPVPAVLGFAVAFAVVMTGTVFSAWRAATAAPRDAMR